MNLLSSVFGVPAAFALDISDSTLQIMEVGGRDLGKVASFSHTDIPKGLMENGRVLDQPKLAEAIRNAIKTASPRKPRTKKVVAELPESQTFTHHFSVERQAGRQNLREAVRLLAEETMPFALAEYVWDFEVLNATDEASEILFAAAPKELVEAYKHTLLLAGLELRILESESMALTRSIVEIKKIPTESLGVVIDIGGRATTLAFVDSNGLELSINIPVAGDSLTAAISTALKIDEAAAEKLKREKGFQDPKAAEAMRAAFSPLIKQYQQATSYIQTKTRRTLRGALLAGGSSALPGIVDELKTMLGLPVDFGKPPFSVNGLLPHQIVVVSGLAMKAKKLSTGINLVQ
jgi:type IV pilus assembly protein PilM